MIPRPRDALLVIDVQHDFLPGGALAVPDGDAILPFCNAMIERFAHVVLTQDWHPAGHASFASTHRRAPFETLELPYGPQVLWPDHCVQGTHGAMFHPDLSTDGAQIVLRKGANPEIDSYSAFFENDRVTPTGLLGTLRELQVDRVALVGLATDYCVLYSALDAREAGLDVVVLSEGTRGIDLNGSVQAAWERMAQAGVIRV